MTRYPVLRIAAVAILAGATQAHAADCVQVEVQNVRPGQGSVMVAAYTDAATFRKTAAASLQVPAGAETMQLQVCGLSGPDVALTLFQDLNGNGKLDTNAFGIPSEPWGSSGKSAPMSAPTWDTARVALDGSLIVVKFGK
jgi:uncharacterized protein (DUF2141 family)